MYIEFRLPTGGGGGGAQHTNWLIIQKLDEWADQYNIKYTKKNIKYTLRVTFEDVSAYSLFAMTWKGAEFRLIETLQFDRY